MTKTHTLAAAHATAGTSQTDEVEILSRHLPEGTLQVVISSVATVQLQGRMRGTSTWCSIGDALTASGGVIVAGFDYYRLSITSNNGTVSAYLSI